MKKLMIAVAMVCAAAMSYGAAASWYANASEICDGTGEENSYSGTALIFNSGITSQSALFEMLAAGTSVSSSTAGYVATDTVSSGNLDGTNFEYGEQGETTTYTFYFAIIDTANKQVYFSNELSASPNSSSSAKGLFFGEQYAYEPGMNPDSNALATTGYSGSGAWASWNNASPTPEPTSGVLLLLGMAGLALRRRRA